ESGGRNLYVIGTALIVLGLVLLYADRTSRRDRDLTTMNRTDAIVTGLAQSCALVPGVSRSGATISRGLFRGFDPPPPPRYSLLPSRPWRPRGREGPASRGAPPRAAPPRPSPPPRPPSPAPPPPPPGCPPPRPRHSTALFVAYRVVLGTLVLVLTASGAIS